MNHITSIVLMCKMYHIDAIHSLYSSLETGKFVLSVAEIMICTVSGGGGAKLLLF